MLEHFRQEFWPRHGKEVGQIHDEVFHRLRLHPWPGNVRELRNLVETMVVLDSDGILGVQDLPTALRSQTPDHAVARGPEYSLSGKTLQEVEKDLIIATLEESGGNRQRAARQLGMGERTLYRKINEYSLNTAK